MKQFFPSYYSEFHCIAGSCPDSCCQEWSVLVDSQTASYYRALPGALGDLLRQTMQEDEDGTILFQEHHKCPLWRKDGLCRIHAESGEQALCQVCAQFPRLSHDYGTFMEFGLELSCPEAARLILSDPGTPWICEETPGGEEPDYDTRTMRILQRSRKAALSYLTNSAYSVTEALTLLLLYGYQVQSELDGADAVPFTPETALLEAKEFAQPAEISALLDFMKGLDVLTEDWRHCLEQPNAPGPWNTPLLAFARYGVQRYWLHAISDYDLISRVKWILISIIIIRYLGGDLTRTAQLYSKEIENDSTNMDAMLDATYTHPAFTDAHLLYWLKDNTVNA